MRNFSWRKFLWGAPVTPGVDEIKERFTVYVKDTTFKPLKYVGRFMMLEALSRDVDEIRALLLNYVKEETIKPLKDLGRYMMWGALGSLFVGFGSVLMLIAVLRYLQWQFPVLNGSLSWVPYVIVALLAAMIMGLAVWRIMSGTAKRRLGVSK